MKINVCFDKTYDDPLSRHDDDPIYLDQEFHHVLPFVSVPVPFQSVEEVDTEGDTDVA